MNSLAILGPGLLGGSLALAARRLGGSRVALWARRAEAVAEIEAMGIADAVSTDVRAIVAGVDLVILCVPVGAMPALAREIADAISPQTIVTDVGSVKAAVVAELGEIFRRRGRFVGSHPMAGSEQTGIRAARAELFEDAACILTPDGASDPAAVAELRAFWQEVGCRVLEVAPAEHDEIVALVSHLRISSPPRSCRRSSRRTRGRSSSAVPVSVTPPAWRPVRRRCGRRFCARTAPPCADPRKR